MTQKKRPIGLHLRLTTTLSDLLEKAERLKSPIMQCFLLRQGESRLAEFSEEEIAACAKIRKKCGNLYLHASYWVNLAGCRNNGWRTFQRELALGNQLGFTHMIIHPGSATGCKTKKEGITCLAKALNKALEKEKNIKIVLENTAHARMTVGGNLSDFKELLKQIEQPERIYFCLDSAHAHSYGYDIADPEKQDIFLDEVDDIIGRDKIALVHLNDTQEKCGSYIDKHAIVGQGKIGEQALRRFMNHPVCKKAPIILEIPMMKDEKEEKDLLEMVKAWDIK